MNELDEERKEIDALDAQMTELFEKRFEAVRKILEYKKQHHMEVLDASREQVILDRNAEKLQNKELDPYYRNWFMHTMEVSREYQNDLLKKERG